MDGNYFEGSSVDGRGGDTVKERAGSFAENVKEQGVADYSGDLG
jgi:hypothetical protein